MDFDNPSYFSVMGNAASSSECSLSRQPTPPRARNGCRDARGYLRSVSSNSADSNQELLIMGEPRLSDLAPDLAFKHPASRSNSLKNRAEANGYIPVATSEEQADTGSGDEVFLGEDAARYYNFTTIKKLGERRHSFGTFGRDRTSSVASSSRSFKEDFPQCQKDKVVRETITIDDHSLRHASYPRKRCTRCTRGTASKLANMDDIFIVSMKSDETASDWVKHFSGIFQRFSNSEGSTPQHPERKMKIAYLGAEELLMKTKEEYKELSQRASGVKLQLVIVSPSLLSFIGEYPEYGASLGNLLLPDRTLALLLGVCDNDLADVHKKALPNYFQWQRQSVLQNQDTTFSEKFTVQAKNILSRIWKQQNSALAQEKSCFSVTPKKIRQGQTSVFIYLTHPLQKEDNVKISVERNDKITEIKSVKKKNPYLIKITVPENLTDITAIVNVLVEKNGSIIGSRPIKCESKLRELEQILRSINNPVEFMCQTLGFSPANRGNLDEWLVQSFQKNLPAHFNLLGNHDAPFAASVQVHKHSNEEFPTLVHFAAKFGFDKLTMQLLDCPGCEHAMEIKNVHDLTPPDMAEVNGFPEVASMLRSHSQMNELSTIYSKIKSMEGSRPSSEESEECAYLTPREVKQPDFYKMCPAPKPYKKSDENNELDNPANSIYMTMSPGVARKREPFDCLPGPSHQEDTRSINAILEEALTPSPKNYPVQKKPEIIVTEDKCQQELLEFLNDFKNKIHDIETVEKLVEEWKNRNDVQKSYEEKQKQLKEMQQRYQEIQNQMKKKMKIPNPLEFLKRAMFSKAKNKLDDSLVVSSPNMDGQVVGGHRPISSLSTSSSGSSGRMSSISGCSLGDSGTHSDNDDRKLSLGGPSDELLHELTNVQFHRCKAMCSDLYTTVPAPKPVKQFSTFSTFPTIEERPKTDVSTSSAESYYIRMPPSGLPVEMPNKWTNSSISEKKPAATPDNHHEYMNVSVQVHQTLG